MRALAVLVALRLSAVASFLGPTLSPPRHHRLPPSRLRCQGVDAPPVVYRQESGEIPEAELQEIYEMALGEEHNKELSKKVEESMLEDWDVREGVVDHRRKPVPLKANIDMWTYYAKQDFLKGNYSSALAWYQMCVDFNPVDGRAWLGMGRVQLKRGSNAGAEKAYKDGLYYNPNNPYILQAYGVLMDKTGRTKEGMRLLTTSIKSNPAHAASWVELGRINQKLGRIDEARFCYRSAVAGDPRSYVALQVWGVLEAEAGSVDEARRLLSMSADLNPRSAHALHAWASMEKRLGNYSEAEALFDRAVAAWPESTMTAASLADLHETMGSVSKARDTFRAAERRAEAVGDAGFFQSWALFELRQDKSLPSSYSRSHVEYEDSRVRMQETDSHRLARSLFKKAVVVNKKHSASWVAWAKFEQRLGNKDVARRLLVAGISNFPTSRNIGWFHCALGNLAKQDKDIDTARACYDRALEATAAHKSLPVILEYANMEVYSGGVSEARRLFELGIARFPQEERIWDKYIDFEKRRSSGENVINILNRKGQLELKKHLGKTIPPHSKRIEE